MTCSLSALAILLYSLWSAVDAAEVLSADDAALLRRLQPASRAALPGWLDAHEVLAAEVSQSRDAGGADLIIYGDSIMEAFRGTSVGTPYLEIYGENKRVFEKQLGNKRSLVLAISGDQTVHLLWRLQNGEGPRGVKAAVITLMIGTNDLSHLSSLYPEDDQRVAHIISLGVQQCVRELQQQAPQARLVVFGLLPLQPIMQQSSQRLFDSKIAAINREIAAFVQQQASDRLTFKDCGAGFLNAEGAVPQELMPDGVHPAGNGAAVLLDCMLEAIRQ